MLLAITCDHPVRVWQYNHGEYAGTTATGEVNLRDIFPLMAPLGLSTLALGDITLIIVGDVVPKAIPWPSKEPWQFMRLVTDVITAQPLVGAGGLAQAGPGAAKPAHHVNCLDSRPVLRDPALSAAELSKRARR